LTICRKDLKTHYRTSINFISGRQQFLNIADLLNVPISQVSDRKTFLEMYFTNMYNSKLSKLLRRVVESV